MVGPSAGELVAIREGARAREASLTALPDATLDAAARAVYHLTGRAAFGDAWLAAMSAGTAHRAVMWSRSATAGGSGSAVGAVTSISERTRSVGFGSGAATAPLGAADADWTQTPHGLEWLALRDSRASVAVLGVY